MINNIHLVKSFGSNIVPFCCRESPVISELVDLPDLMDKG